MTPAFFSSSPLPFFPTHSSQSRCTRSRHPVVTMSASDNRRGILFLCLGNICRSPAAEAVMNGVLTRRNLTDQFFVDSCGTGGGSPTWYLEGGFSNHEGDPADPRMRAAAIARGLTLESRSRPLRGDDFHRFELIVGMDESNIESIEIARNHWNVSKDAPAQVALMSHFSPDHNFRGRPVPDPYWSGPKGFDYALDLIEGACDGLADHLTASKLSS